MITYFKNRRKSLPYRVLSAFVAFTFSFSYIVPPSSLYAQGLPAAVMNLPVPGTPVPLTPGFTPPRIIGMTIHADNPLMFDFMVDPGDTKLNDQKMQDESLKLVKYFLASLTVPADKLWVNLSPYEKDKIVPEEFGQTEMGTELLAQDYMLKQLTASLMNPEDELGRKFWDRVYEKAQKLFGTTEIPLNTFNKVWIVPEKAVVYNNGLNVFILESHLKVMMEEDYLSLQHHSAESPDAKSDVVSGVSSSVIKEVLLPEIEKEVNEGKTFANLRQIHNSLILAAWYKQNLKESLLGQIYADKAKTGGLTVQDTETSQKIYEQYVAAFQKGVYNFIKEDYDPATKQIIPRKYFSGGVTEQNLQVEGQTLPDPKVLKTFAADAKDASVITAGVKSPGEEISFNMPFPKTTPAASPVSIIVDKGNKISILKKTMGDRIEIEYRGRRDLRRIVDIRRWVDDSIITVGHHGSADEEIQIWETRSFDEDGKRINMANPKASFIDIAFDGHALTITNATESEIIVHASSPVVVTKQDVRTWGGFDDLKIDEAIKITVKPSGKDLKKRVPVAEVGHKKETVPSLSWHRLKQEVTNDIYIVELKSITGKNNLLFNIGSDTDGLSWISVFRSNDGENYEFVSKNDNESQAINVTEAMKTLTFRVFEGEKRIEVVVSQRWFDLLTAIKERKLITDAGLETLNGYRFEFKLASSPMTFEEAVQTRRTPLAAFNLKGENINIAQWLEDVAADYEANPRNRQPVWVAPAHEDLFEASQIINQLVSSGRVPDSHIVLGAQDVRLQPYGAYTGHPPSLEKLKQLKVKFVILGHSELSTKVRGEPSLVQPNELIGQKYDMVVDDDTLIPIVAIGETAQENRDGKTEEVLSEQLKSRLGSKSAQEIIKAGTIIANEPVWAIGEDRVRDATAEDADAAATFTRRWLFENKGEDVAAKTRIQFGGSVSGDNVAEINALPNVDGALVGSKSKSWKTAQPIHKEFERTAFALLAADLEKLARRLAVAPEDVDGMIEEYTRAVGEIVERIPDFSPFGGKKKEVVDLSRDPLRPDDVLIGLIYDLKHTSKERINKLRVDASEMKALPDNIIRKKGSVSAFRMVGDTADFFRGKRGLEKLYGTDAAKDLKDDFRLLRELLGTGLSGLTLTREQISDKTKIRKVIIDTILAASSPAKAADFTEIRNAHHYLLREIYQNLGTIQTDQGEKDKYIEKIRALQREMSSFKDKMVLWDDYKWLNEASTQWHMVLLLQLNVFGRFEISMPPPQNIIMPEPPQNIIFFPSKLGEIQEAAHILYMESLKNQVQIRDNEELKGEYIKKVEALFNKMSEFKDEEVSLDDFKWLLEASVRWTELFSSVFNTPFKFKIHKPQRIILPERTDAMTASELLQWMEQWGEYLLKAKTEVDVDVARSIIKKILDEMPHAVEREGASIEEIKSRTVSFWEGLLVRATEESKKIEEDIQGLLSELREKGIEARSDEDSQKKKGPASSPMKQEVRLKLQDDEYARLGPDSQGVMWANQALDLSESSTQENILQLFRRAGLDSSWKGQQLSLIVGEKTVGEQKVFTVPAMAVDNGQNIKFIQFSSRPFDYDHYMGVISTRLMRHVFFDGDIFYVPAQVKFDASPSGGVDFVIQPSESASSPVVVRLEPNAGEYIGNFISRVLETQRRKGGKVVGVLNGVEITATGATTEKKLYAQWNGVRLEANAGEYIGNFISRVIETQRRKGGKVVGVFNKIEIEIRATGAKTEKELYAELYAQWAKKGAEKSTSSPLNEGPEKKGGIDLNPGNMDLRTNYGADRIRLPMPDMPLENIKIDGLVPFIIHVAPITNLPLLLGLADQPETDVTAGLRPQHSPADAPRQFKAREAEEVGLLN